METKMLEQKGENIVISHTETISINLKDIKKCQKETKLRAGGKGKA